MSAVQFSAIMLIVSEGENNTTNTHKEALMKNREIVPNEKECISQCIIKFWSASSKQMENRDERYERCLTNCDVCGSS